MAPPAPTSPIANSSLGVAPVDALGSGAPGGDGPADGPADGNAGRAAPWVLSTYFAQGLPWSVVNQVAGEFLTAMRVDLATIGLLSLYHLPWNLKALWAPIVDRVLTLRRWLVLMQLAVGVLTIALAAFAGREIAPWFFVLLTSVALASATHDIALDGYYLVALGKGDQAALSGMRVAAYKVALMVGRGGLVVVGGALSFAHSFAVAGGVLIVLAAIHGLTLPSTETRSAAGGSQPFVEGFKAFVKAPHAAVAIALIVCYRAGDSLMFAMNAPFLRDLGLSTELRGVISGVFGNVASIVGGLAGGVLISRRGLAKTIFPVAMVQGFGILLYPLLAVSQPSIAMTSVVVIIERLVEGFGTSALMVFLMFRSRGDFPATHFAIGSGLASLASTGAGAGSGFLAERVGYPTFFLLAFVASLPGIVLCWRMALYLREGAKAPSVPVRQS